MRSVCVCVCSRKMVVRLRVFAFRAIKMVIESAHWEWAKVNGCWNFCGSNAMLDYMCMDVWVCVCGLQWSGWMGKQAHGIEWARQLHHSPYTNTHFTHVSILKTYVNADTIYVFIDTLGNPFWLNKISSFEW